LRVWGRAGRAVGPGRTKRYLLPSPWGKITPLEKVTVTVSRASFFRGKGIETSPVSVKRIEDYDLFDDYLKREIKQTHAVLRNSLPHPVSVLMRAYARTGGTSTLAFASLEPNEERVVGDERLKAAPKDHLPTVDRLRGRFERIEIVDWSVLLDEAHGDARGDLERAWRGRYRWPYPSKAPVEGNVAFDITDHQSGAKAKGTASFVLPGQGPSTLASKPALDDALQSAVLQAIYASLRELRAISLEELLERTDIELVDRQPGGIVVVHARPKALNQYVLDHPVMTLTDGRITAATDASLALTEIITFTNTVLPDGRYAHGASETLWDTIPTGVTLIEKQGIRHEEERGLVRPADAVRETFDRLGGARRFSSRIAFTGLRLSQAIESGTPAGEGASVLRAAWTRPWLYPTAPRDLSGTLEIDTEATLTNWLNEKTLKGRLNIVGWTGSNGAPHSGYEFRVSGKFSTEGRQQIGDLARARLSIWTRGDFAGRALFDEAFRGCTIRRTETDGVLVVEGHAQINGVRIENGLPVEIRYRDGTRVRRVFQDYRGHLVPTRTEWIHPDRTAVLTATFRNLGQTLLFPTRIEIKDWFHAGWGPEIYTFSLK
jgi:hypothetical protein